jgi:hypothetical protein
MTLEQMNEQIINLCNKIFSIREYSYQRRGAKFDPRRPNLLLCPDEEQRIKDLEQQVADLLTEYTKDELKRHLEEKCK